MPEKDVSYTAGAFKVNLVEAREDSHRYSVSHAVYGYITKITRPRVVGRDSDTDTALYWRPSVIEEAVMCLHMKRPLSEGDRVEVHDAQMGRHIGGFVVCKTPDVGDRGVVLRRPFNTKDMDKSPLSGLFPTHEFLAPIDCVRLDISPPN
jgi:hypothetical protein